MINEQLKKDKNYQKFTGNKNKTKKQFNVKTEEGIDRLHNFAKALG